MSLTKRKALHNILFPSYIKFYLELSRIFQRFIFSSHLENSFNKRSYIFHIFDYFKISFTYIYIIGSLITLKHMQGTLQFCVEIRPFLLFIFFNSNILKNILRSEQREVPVLSYML